MGEPMGHGWCSRAELKRRKKLRQGIDGQPQPENTLGATQAGAQFVQLNVWELEVAESVRVPGPSMHGLRATTWW